VLADLPLAVVDLVLVIVVVRCVGALAVRIGEPRIAGEMAGAILIGPTVLGGQIEGVVDGAKATGVAGALFPAGAVDVLTWLGALGMILYMLLVGLTIDPRPMRRRLGTVTVLVAAMAGSMALLAVIAAPWLRDDGGWKGPRATSLAFLLALGAALAAQGVPIAARILEERGLLRCEIGRVVIATGAAVTTLALVASGVAIQGGDGAALGQLALVFAGAAVLGAGAVAIAYSPRMRLPARVALALLIVIALAAGFGGKALIGTVLIGPLIVGIAVRNEGFSALWLEARLGRVVRGGLLPVFLGVAALHTNLRELHLDALPAVAAIIAAVVAIKLAGGYASARAVGFDRGEALAMGALLQCGGVMTIAISLDVLQAGIITTRTHALLTLVGLVTTVVAGPLLARSGLSDAEADADRSTAIA
jgi:Kef-type K+ transport system membrane component KefB